jgi:hypothetical protein
MQKYHYIYKILRSDGFYYIGIHSTKRVNDYYMGSGTRITNSIKKHGKSVHIKIILEFCDDRKTLIDREQEIVNKNCLADPYCMNLRVGGCYYGEYHGLKGVKKTEVHKERIRQSKTGQTLSVETIEKRQQTRKDRGINTINQSKGRRWINNGSANRMIDKNVDIPEGFVEGRIFFKAYKPRMNPNDIIACGE